MEDNSIHLSIIIKQLIIQQFLTLQWSGEGGAQQER